MKVCMHEIAFLLTKYHACINYDAYITVDAGMSCHNQCNETYRCWGPADTDCVVCRVYLYRNGAERICVDSCDSTRLQSLNV